MFTIQTLMTWAIRILIVLELVSGFNPSEEYESQLGLLFPIHGKTQNVTIHQPNYNPLSRDQLHSNLETRRVKDLP